MTTPYKEKYRPQFHFTARENWLNDPNGLVFYRGEYHLFFQHNPTGIEWGNMTWGHAVSDDMLNWRQLDNALLPDSLGTMFSGSAVIDHHNTAGFGAGALVLIYTAAGGTSDESNGQPFTQCLAYSNDGRNFTKYAGNPVLGNIADGNRDPKVIWHEPTKNWIMTLYLTGSDFAFYTSPNLKDWTHLQTITVPGCDECPDFFPLTVDGDPAQVKWVWTAANARYLAGDFDGQLFTPDESEARPLAGDNYYAVQTFSEMPDGRRVQMAWLNGLEYPDEMPFNQQMGIPVELTLRTAVNGLRLCAAPIRELEKLRISAYAHDTAEITPEAPFNISLQDFNAAGYDADIEIIVGNAKQVEILLCGIPILWDSTAQMLNEKMPLPVIEGKIGFRALIDRASIEIFASNGESILVVKGLPQIDAPGLSILVRDESIILSRLEIFGLSSVW
ncbi:MAG: glycoside hydrolase family 32 protein [bacterium]